MIADTDFFIDLMHPGSAYHTRAARKAKELAEQGVRLLMTAVTRFELATGIEQAARQEDERERVHRLVREFPTYALDGPAAHHAGLIHGSLRAAGMPVGVMDTLIAAIALAHGEPLLTRNLEDFRRISGLMVETY